MSKIKSNKNFYDRYDWSRGGEEWSVDWGSTFNFWYATMLPRIGHFLPAGKIVEIGCGFGRVSHYLADYCESLDLFDVSQRCVENCNSRFAGRSHIKAWVNDGVSLEPVSDASADFIFSINSLVFTDANTIRSYLREASRILSTEGVCFLHHSNCASYLNDPVVNSTELADHRDIDVSAKLVRRWAKSEGLFCTRQELVNWGFDYLLSDCFSLLVKRESSWEKRFREIVNPRFCEEMKYLKGLAKHYQTSIIEAEGGEVLA